MLYLSLRAELPAVAPSQLPLPGLAGPSVKLQARETPQTYPQEDRCAVAFLVVAYLTFVLALGFGFLSAG